jgi:alpha-ketoglutarate-dependent taurine dioxygenase
VIVSIVTQRSLSHAHRELDARHHPERTPPGAEIVGVDLSEEIDDETFHAIDAAYNAHTVLVFCNQGLTPAKHLRFGRCFGELEVSPRTQFALPDVIHPVIRTRPVTGR